MHAPVVPAEGRYTAVAVVLHWLMAIAVIWMLMLGLYMTSDSLPDKAAKFQLFQLHKSVGITLLWLIAVRLAWRLTHPAPELTGPYLKWERAAAAVGHVALYILMLGMPLSGWLLVSSSPLGLPTILFQSGFAWPHVPGVASNEAVNNAADTAHYWLAMALIAAIAGHVLAVAKHWFVDRQNILARMWFRRGAKLLPLVIVLGLAAAPLQAKPYAVDYKLSTLAFSGIYAEKPFAGTFEKWSAAIDFDPTAPASAKIEVAVDTASAKTGNVTNDTTLPTADWFDAAAYPQATFRADGVEAKGQGSYIAHGMLTIKGKAVKQDLAFVLTPADGNGPTAVTGVATLNRLDYNLGVKSDPLGEWVGKEIKLTLTMQAKPQ